MNEAALILAVAQAIEGPHNLNNILSAEKLAESRRIRWEMLPRQTQNYRMIQACAAILAASSSE